MTFTEVIEIEEGVVCTDIFPTNATSFGSESSCKAYSNNLDVHLLGNPTVGLGYLVLDMTKVNYTIFIRV